MLEKTTKTEKRGRPYPRVTLEEALKIAQIIKEKNGGNPWPPSEIAKAVGIASKGNPFFYQTSAAQAFGLTKGTRDANEITLETLGRDIIYAPSSQKEFEKKREAFFNIKIFKEVFEYYKGGKLPETQYLKNTLESKFGLNPNYHEEFVEMFRKNTKYLGLESSQDILQDSVIPEANLANKKTNPETVVVSEAKGGRQVNSKEIFVIMPFGERTEKYFKGFFAEVLASLITPAASETEFTVRTARRTGSDVIQSTIINALLSADLVIADLTEHNPNVLFELGVRMAMEKPVLLIRAEGTEKIFDVDNMLRVFDYKPMLWPSTLKDDIPELTKHIKAAWKSREDKTYMQILRGGAITTELK